MKVVLPDGTSSISSYSKAMTPSKALPAPGATSGKPLGLGSTGRIEPINLTEKLAMEQAISNPTAGRQLPVPMTDSRWPASSGWVKMSQNVNGVEVHYVRNIKTGAIDDFKFK